MSEPVQPLSPPPVVEELVERFREHAVAYGRPDYNETELRRDFLDPFFEALGWDVANRQGHAEAYREVVHEDRVKVGGATKAPDYAFRVGGVRKFFVEAKKPAVDLRLDPAPAYQLRRYAWSAHLPLSILTDFEELAVYDCRMKPASGDRASVGRTLVLACDEYPARWGELAAVFSKEAILRGAFDAYAESTKAKRGTAEVDDAFLADLETWREALARHIALRNPGLSVRALNDAVQVTLDRMIFLRICEDRAIEPYGQLQALLNGHNVYGRLGQIFSLADDRYNSGLFHFRAERGRPSEPDDWTLGLVIDDKPLKDIIKHLYYPDGPYEFSVVPADILGQVYERFLGKVIRLTPGGRAVVEEKPEVRKAGGVYYTPTYIVDYIVANTVGRLIEGKTPAEVAEVRVLDPACGSGSFLLGAYQCLLDWYLNWYTEHRPERHKKAVRPTSDGGWALTTDERKRILTANIYGVDIDPQAVEVTKLSLMLRVLEGETSETLGGQLRLMQERALPDLDRNIQCGNSLIGPDFYEGRQVALFDEDTSRRVNAFDWQRAFPQVMAGGGFDVVIGNPPYIRIHQLVDSYPEETRYLQATYRTAAFGKVDVFVAFVERGLSCLRDTGRMGFIVPNKFVQSDYGRELRRLLAMGQHLLAIVDFGHAQVFQGATTYTCLLFAGNQPAGEFEIAVNQTNMPAEAFLSAARLERQPIDALRDAPWVLTSRTEVGVIERVERRGTSLLGFLALAVTGVKTGANAVFVVEELRRDGDLMTVSCEADPTPFEVERAILRPYAKAASLRRYEPVTTSRWLVYPYELDEAGRTALMPESAVAEHFPLAYSHLRRHRGLLESRQKGRITPSMWHGLSFASDMRMFTARKLVTPTLAPQNRFTSDSSSVFFPQGAGGGCGLVPAPEADADVLLGVLNSRLLSTYFGRISSRFQGGYYAYEPRYLRRLPVYLGDPSVTSEASLRGQLAGLVQCMLELHRSPCARMTTHDRAITQRRIEATDHEIDRLVYAVYGLTDDEIAIVEARR